MGSTFNSRDQRHSYIGDVLDNLNTFIMDLAPNAGIGNIAERCKIDTRNELPACSRQDHDLVRAILRDPVESINELGVILRSKSKRRAIGMKLGNQHAFGVARQIQAAVGSEVVVSNCLQDVLPIPALNRPAWQGGC